MNGIKQPILITVPKYITISSNLQNTGSSSSSEGDSCLDEFLIRGKRKRLDHLTWEEKLQRKKLKNRVAAQTSRDKKKAKMEEMENTIKLLTDENSTLQNRCDSLEEQNEKLSIRNNELERRLDELEKRLNSSEISKKTFSDVSCETINSGSAAGNSQSANKRKCRKERNSITVENNSTVSTLQDMLGDFDMSQLEELAESLLADITTNLEDDSTGSCTRTTEIESPTIRMSRQMVGTTTEQLESSENNSRSIKKIKISSEHSKNSAPTNNHMNQLTYIFPEEDEDEISTNNKIEEVISTNLNDNVIDSRILLSPLQSNSSIIEDKSSPFRSNYSDSGYDSIGSPNNDHFNELWNDSFSELFPSLV